MIIETWQMENGWLVTSSLKSGITKDEVARHHANMQHIGYHLIGRGSPKPKFRAPLTKGLKLQDRILAYLDKIATELPEVEGMTCKIIAERLSDQMPTGFHVTPESVNAAMSGMSNRCRPRSRRYVTDGNETADTPWQRRYWKITPLGRQQVSYLKAHKEKSK